MNRFQDAMITLTIGVAAGIGLCALFAVGATKLQDTKFLEVRLFELLTLAAALVSVIVVTLQLAAMRADVEHARDAVLQSQRQVELSQTAAQSAVWIEAQRVFTTKEFKNANGTTRWSFGDIRGKVMAIERPVHVREWDSGVKVVIKNQEVLVTKDEALDVCRGMCEVADLVQFGGLDLRVALVAWGDPFRKTWIVLAPLVRNEQANEVREWPLLWARFESVGESALRWLGWPKGWIVRKGVPRSERLASVGWKWTDVLPRDPKFDDPPSEAIPPQIVAPDKWTPPVPEPFQQGESSPGANA